MMPVGHWLRHEASSVEAQRRTHHRLGKAGMARVSDEDWDKLQTFDTLQLIEAVDEVDSLRGMLADDGTRPPVLRDNLDEKRIALIAAQHNGG